MRAQMLAQNEMLRAHNTSLRSCLAAGHATGHAASGHAAGGQGAACAVDASAAALALQPVLPLAPGALPAGSAPSPGVAPGHLA